MTVKGAGRRHLEVSLRRLSLQRERSESRSVLTWAALPFPIPVLVAVQGGEREKV